MRNWCKSQNSVAVILVVFLAITSLNHWAAAAADKLSGSNAKEAATETQWYKGRRFIWRNVFTREQYESLVQKLPTDEQAMLAAAHPFDLFPLDLHDGSNHPHLSYVYSVAGRIDGYARTPSLQYIDLYARREKDILVGLRTSTASIVTLPEKGVNDTSLAALLADKAALPNLIHLDIYAAKGVLTPKVLASLKGQRTLRSLQLSGPDVDDQWIAELARVDGLRAVRLYRTSVTAQGLAALKQMTELTHLGIEGGRPPTDDAARAIAACPQLRELQLTGEWTKDDVLSTVATTAQLERLALDEVRTSPDGIKALEGSKRLRTVVAWSSDPKVLSALHAWQSADRSHRELYDSPDPRFSGWIGELPVFWMNPREVDPMNFP